MERQCKSLISDHIQRNSRNPKCRTRPLDRTGEDKSDSAHPEMKYIIVGANGVSNSEMRDFFAELGRTRVFAEAYN